MYCVHICPVKSINLLKLLEEVPIVVIILSHSQNHLCLWNVISNGNLAALWIGTDAELVPFEGFTCVNGKALKASVISEGKVLIATLSGQRYK